MAAPRNVFKEALREGRPQIGLWQALANPYSVEICAGAGFDWLLIDAEHAPNDLPLILSQLQAMKGGRSQAVVRPPVGETARIKQLLDIGVQNLLVPMVDSAEMAAELVRAVRYPPRGIRGVGAALARASDFNRIGDYLTTADEQICLLLQVESSKGIAELEAVAGVDGVDGVFIGPADLAADLGYLGKPGAPEVQDVVENALRRIRSAGKASGILTADPLLARRYLELGATFVAVGSDIAILMRGAAALLKNISGDSAVAPANLGPY